ncbi:nucleoside-diphosphate kinase [Streptococcus sp. DD12]|uniref:nucleoside-diphosphate kinase n=1 Tax=Streptococcus sp. DD12 TaxID=1777880 RepID=UPI00079A0C15|nr:nucleoside-diphosphate kinase [Streptococcus sp. DD12]KXT76635.1 Nucleoside diphosphate kinase [Streptococcus sp. DD12]
MEKTFFMIKPDAVERGIVGEIIHRIERRGYQIEELNLLTLDKSRLDQHYAHIVDRPFYPSTVDYMTEGPSVIGVLSGPDVVEGWRHMMGATNPGEAVAGTIRGDFATAPVGDHIRNVVHGSDSIASAQREIGIWFN